MPSCLTKSFAVFHCLRARPRHSLQRQLTPSTPRPPQRTKDRHAPTKLRSWVATCRSAPKSGRRTPPISENRPEDRSPTNVAGTRIHRPSLRATRLRVLDQVSFTALVIIAVVFSVSADAASDEATQLFQVGRIAFENEDYAAALDAFEAAAQADLQGPAVHFNIGVSAFRLGRYKRAETAFQEVARTPAMAALGYYNLGLIALRRNDSRRASLLFERAAQNASDERLRALAEARLAELPVPPRRPLVGYASLGAGYDDNVALISDSEVVGVSGLEDAFAEGQFATSYPLASAWRLDAGLMFADYQELDSFDQLGAQGGARYRVLGGSWTSDIAVEFSYTTLDGEGFDNTQTLSLQTSRELPDDWRLRARYRYSDIDGMNEFSGVGGSRHEASTRADVQQGQWALGLEYNLEVSDLQDETLSTTRNQFAFDLRRDLNVDWSLALDATLRHSVYAVSENGTEDRMEIGLAITRALSMRWRVVVRYAYADNDSDIPELNYERNRIGASIEALL
jgi:tetratricopeptide (TPR) repeat protein